MENKRGPNRRKPMLRSAMRQSNARFHPPRAVPSMKRPNDAPRGTERTRLRNVAVVAGSNPFDMAIGK